MKSQKQVVVDAVMAIMGSAYNAATACKPWFDARPEQKKQLSESVMSSFTNGECELKSEQENLSTYVSGLISNHLRKAKELNGNTTYVPTNPGTRTGQQDEGIKEARKLLKQYAEGTPEHTRITGFITSRQSELRAEKAKASVDANKLPDELKDLVG